MKLRDEIKNNLLDFFYGEKCTDDAVEDILNKVIILFDKISLDKRNLADCDCVYNVNEQKDENCGCFVRDYNGAIDDLESIKDRIRKTDL